jgi:hypothetical protein
MNILLRALPLLLPLVVRWAEREQKYILKNGVPLVEPSLSDAIDMGVAHPERIRLLKVDRIPTPGNSFLYVLGRIAGLISDTTAGMTLYYGIYVRSEYWQDRQLIAHECVHTAQYERAGGLPSFLKRYLYECLDVGYLNSPMEQEAILKSSKIQS